MKSLMRDFKATWMGALVWFLGWWLFFRDWDFEQCLILLGGGILVDIVLKYGMSWKDALIWHFFRTQDLKRIRR